MHAKKVLDACDLPKIWEKPFYTEEGPMYNHDDEAQPAGKSSIIKYVIDCVYEAKSKGTRFLIEKEE